MLFINPENEYPRHIGDLQLAHPDWSEGDELPNGWQQVAYAASLPECQKDEIVFENEPALVDSVLTQSFNVRKLTTAEIARLEKLKL